MDIFLSARGKLPYLCCCLIFFCTRQPLAAKETKQLDSMAAQYMPLIQKEAKDTSRIRIWIRYGNSLSWIAPDSARRVLIHALDSSHIAHYDRGISICLMALGNYYSKRGIKDTSLIYNLQALEHVKKIQPTNNSLASKIYGNIATIYMEYGAYKESVKYYHQAISSAELSASRPSQAQAYNNIATVLEALGEDDKALEYINLGKAVALKYREATYLLAYLYLNEGSLLLKQGKMEEAASVLCQVLQLGKQYRPTDILNEMYELLGRIAEKRQKPKEALQYFHQALLVASDYPLGKMNSLFSLAKTHLTYKNYSQAKVYLAEALNLAQSLNNKKTEMEIYGTMAKIYKLTGHYQAAYIAIEKNTLLKDSLISIERIVYLNTLEAQYQTAKKDKEIAEKKLFIRQQETMLTKKNIWIGSLATAITIAIAGFTFFYYYRQRIQKQKEEINAWHAMTEGEEKERGRIARELHDGIGGLLSTVKMYFGTIQKQNPALVESDDYDEAMGLLENTLTEVRNTAHNLMPELLLRDGLAECIRVLCNTISKKKQLKIDFHYYGFIDRLKSSFELSAYRIIQELVQNILKHSEASTALVQLSQHDNILSITVEDNGIGMDETSTQENGIGLKNVRQRVIGLNGSFNIKTGKGQGTSIHLEFNLKKHKNLIA